VLLGVGACGGEDSFAEAGRRFDGFDGFDFERERGGIPVRQDTLDLAYVGGVPEQGFDAIQNRVHVFSHVLTSDYRTARTRFL